MHCRSPETKSQRKKDAGIILLKYQDYYAKLSFWDLIYYFQIVLADNTSILLWTVEPKHLTKQPTKSLCTGLKSSQRYPAYGFLIRNTGCICQLLSRANREQFNLQRKAQLFCWFHINLGKHLNHGYFLKICFYWTFSLLKEQKEDEVEWRNSHMIGSVLRKALVCKKFIQS